MARERARQVALLRGVNVGGRRRVAMAALRSSFEEQGFTEVTTYIQSGNVVFRAAGKVDVESVEAALAARFGAEISVVVRTGAQIDAVLAANPFDGEDSKLVHVAFLARRPTRSEVGRLDLDGYDSERAVVRGAEIYYHLPNGMGRSRLPAHVDRRLGVPATVRNLTTVAKLADLARG